MDAFRFLQVVDAGVLVMDPAKNVVLHANPKAMELLGLAGKELAGRVCSGLLSVREQGTHAPVDLANLRFPCETTLAGAAGKRLPVLITSRPLKTPQGLLTVLTLTDLTPQKEVERKYKSFFKNAVEGVFQSSPDGRFIAVNPALCDILGYESPEEVLASFTDLKSQLYVDPADRDYLLASLEANGQVTSFETRFKRKDGGERWINTSARQVRDEDGKLLYIEGLNVDITARKKAEHALTEMSRSFRESEEKFRRTFDQSPIGAAMLDLDWNFLRANEAFCRITGYGEEELLGRDSFILTHPDDMQGAKTRSAGLRSGAVDHYEIDKRYVRKDGQVVWVHLSAGLVRDAKGEPLYYLPMVQDITERVRSDRALKEVMEEKERLRLNLEAVFRSIPDAIIVVDTAMNVLQTNRALNELCCIGGENTRGKPLHLVGGRCKRACFTVLEATLKTREPVQEYRVECKGHRPGQTVVINSSPLLDSDNNFVGAVLAIRDITRLADLEKRLTDLHSHRGLIGKSKVMRSIYAVLDQLSEVESTVLITGESGTGKELVAEALHYGGPRAKGPLIKVNCSALSESLLESELFGHVRGAFTGAIRDKIGRFEAADGGTIFLDEIGDISPRIQLNLLRVLERKEFERVGDSKTRRANVRVLAATNADIPEKIRQGLFREDLYYRLKVMVIHLPPLRERTEDVPLLCEHFLAQFRAGFGKRIGKLGEDVMKVFMTYPWPGNVRELRSALEHACILCPGGDILSEHLPPELAHGQRADWKGELVSRSGLPEPLFSGFSRRQSLSREDILTALRSSANNRAKAARLLGIDRRTLYRNMDKFAIQ